MDKPKFWSIVTPLPAPVIQMQAKMAEDVGLEGLFAAQVYGPPFIPLAAAAMVTNRVRLASGIAIASARSPFETAMAAIDLDRISGGRFTLGLGTSVRSWSEGFYGGEYGKPLASLRETVEIVRMSIAKAHTGELTNYEGHYHHHDWSELQPPAPPLRTDIPVWIAALRGPLTSLAAEIADGVIGHPIWSVEWCVETIPSWLKRGLDKAGKQRSDIEFNAWLFVAINDDRKQALDDARATVAFYGGVAQYQEFFAAHGFEREAKLLQEGVKQGDYIGAARHVTDEMAQTFVVCGTADEVRKRIEPMYELVDSLTLVPPAYNLGPDKLLAYSAAIAGAFYA
ncbi:MAG TPA: LLM class flavin-dependent oxidoreductase [Dehalococcoidia bacterium]|nr:LLM class flavin-dependent oxidoreductase [Dehalococcoidia bacterium]